METRTLDDYCQFAFGIQFLRRPHGALPEYVIAAIEKLLHSLPDHGLTHAAHQASPILSFKNRLQQALQQNRQPFVLGLPDSWINDLSAIMEPIVRNVTSEGRSIVLARLDLKAASARLRAFGHSKLTTDQEAIKAETTQCMEIGAFRAAMVMGWNLAYDVIRRWVFDVRLSDFNNVLITKERKKGKQYPAIVEYEDFFVVQERDVLNWSQQANLINEKVHRALVEKLDRRNDYAHANFKHPDATQVMAYLNELMTILEDTPFRFGK